MALEERVARIEGILEQMDKRLNHIESDLAGMRSELLAMRAETRGEIAEIRNRFWWIIGIIIPMWVTIILAILLR